MLVSSALLCLVCDLDVTGAKEAWPGPVREGLLSHDRICSLALARGCFGEQR